MAPDDFTTEMRAVLTAEREAIRSLDSAAVRDAAVRKESLLAVVTRATDAERPALLAGLAVVREELKRNLVLLAHARDCVREAMTRVAPKAGLPGSRVSIQL